MINPLLSISSRLADVVAPEIVENNVETSSSSGFVFSAWLIWVIVALFFIIL